MRDIEQEVREMENKAIEELTNNIKAMCEEACSPAHIAEMIENAKNNSEVRKLEEEIKQLKVIESVFDGTIKYPTEGK